MGIVTHRMITVICQYYDQVALGTFQRTYNNFSYIKITKEFIDLR